MEASSWRLLDGAKSNTTKEFLQRRRERSKKTTQSWRVSVALSAYAHEPAQQSTPEKTKTETNLKQEKQCKLNNQ
jgi:hypothetical protein